MSGNTAAELRHDMQSLFDLVGMVPAMEDSGIIKPDISTQVRQLVKQCTDDVVTILRDRQGLATGGGNAGISTSP